MAIASHSNKSNQLHKEQKTYDTRLITPNPILPMPDDRDVSHIKPIKDTFSNKTAFNPERYIDILGSLMAYPEGSLIKVTYLSTKVPSIDKRSHVTDISKSRDIVHDNYIRIHNFELKLSNAINSSYNQESGHHDFIGEAVAYPGFEPFTSDMFLYEIGNRKIGLFRLTNVEPMTIRQGTYYKINFKLYEYITDELLKDIESKIIDEQFFDKEKYFNDHHTLLKHKDYIQLETLRQLKKELAKKYFHFFYDELMQTIIRPDKLYDPYIVKYILQKVDLQTIGFLPLMLITYLPDYDDSIWGYLSSDRKGIKFTDLIQDAHTEVHRVDMYRTDLNTLINKSYVKLGKLDIHADRQNQPLNTYGFNKSFYNNDQDKSINEMHMLNVLLNDKFNISELIDVMSDYRNLTNMDKFYFMPLYMYVTDKCIRKL
jgi:hypothetical protein